MIIVMKKGANPDHIKAVVKDIRQQGFEVHESVGKQRIILGCVGDVEADKIQLSAHFSALPGVEDVQLISKPFKLVSRDFHPENLVVKLNGIEIGGKKIIVIAGPCAVESKEQILTTAEAIKKAGASGLRGGAFKPRTSPYSFQGLGKKGLKFLDLARRQTGLLVVTEVMNINQVTVVKKYADILQIGARNMSNFDLLKKAGQDSHPILLKRGPSATIDELLLAAEYILSEGNNQIILCERGIVGPTATKYTRYVADISAIPVLKKETYLPVFFDPSHATGRQDLILPMSLAAIAAGADGLIIEVHPNPAKAKSDAKQQITPDEFTELMEKLKPVAQAIGRQI